MRLFRWFINRPRPDLREAAEAQRDASERRAAVEEQWPEVRELTTRAKSDQVDHLTRLFYIGLRGHGGRP